VLESLPKNDLLAELLIFYIFLAILSTVFALKKLFRSGFNSEGRSFFFKKQFGYVLAFSVMWQINVLNTYYELFNNSRTGAPLYAYNTTTMLPTNPKTDDFNPHKIQVLAHIVATVAGVTLLSSGIVLTVLRLREPLF